MLSQNRNSAVISTVGDSVALKKLIARAKKGDTAAFGQVYELLYKPLYRYVFSRAHSKELAEDISQQVFLKFYEALATYSHDTSPLAYLFTIAKRLLINHGEKKTFVPMDDADMEAVSSEENIIDEAHVRLLSEKINDYLPLLTKDEEEVIRLYFYAELSYKEIRDILDKEEPYLRKIKERALTKLRALTKELYDEHA